MSVIFTFYMCQDVLLVKPVEQISTCKVRLRRYKTSGIFFLEYSQFDKNTNNGEYFLDKGSCETCCAFLRQQNDSLGDFSFLFNAISRLLSFY